MISLLAKTVFLIWGLLYVSLASARRLGQRGPHATKALGLITKRLDVIDSPNLLEKMMEVEEKNEYPTTTVDNDNPVDSRIVGGNHADPARFPYYVRVVTLKANGDVLTLCGGSVIHEDYVLCAAHCWVGGFTDEIAGMVLFANYTQYRPVLGGTGYEQERRGISVRYHPDYALSSNGVPNHDFLLIQVDRGFVDIPPVTLNRDFSFPAVGTSLTIMGFGDTVTGGDPSIRLNEVAIDVISHENCNDENSFRGTINENTMLCAGDQGGKGACQGDSGGPGVVLGDDPSLDIQVGVVSFGGVECATTNFPSVFSRVSFWVDAIVEAICGDTAFPNGFLCGNGEMQPPLPPAQGGDNNNNVCAGQTPFVLDLVTDRYPTETSWQLKSAITGEVIKTNPVLEEETNYEETICLSRGCYAFTILDTFGDGICCGFGQGAYSLRLSEEVLWVGGDYTHSEETQFGVPDHSACEDGGIPVISIPTPPPTPSPTPEDFVLCFSGSTTVTVLTENDQHHVQQQQQQPQQQQVLMRNLQIGDYVLTANNEFEPVYGFGHYHPDSDATFLRIFTDPTSKPLEISHNHMVFVVDDEGQERAVPSSMLKVGDTLQTLEQQVATVTKIDTIRRKGVYAPFTPSGTIVVNQQIVASTFVAFSDSSHILQIGEISTGLSYQWLAHAFETPHRWFCQAFLEFSYCRHETYDEVTGISNWVHRPLLATQWLIHDDNYNQGVMKLVLLLPFVALWGVLWAMEQAATWVLVATGVAVSFVWYKIGHQQKRNNSKRL